jgi:hypothetical protein
MEFPRMHRIAERAGSDGNSRIALPPMLPSAFRNGVDTPGTTDFAAK